tara:strand:+ start:181 stop:900 length:720 start_codon:yes stop_codon:yes gene_type:complete
VIYLTTCTAWAGQRLTIVRGQNFPPYHYLDEKGELTGFIIDIITGVSHTLTLDIRFAQYPWSRCLHLVKIGEADAMMNLFKTPERETFMIFEEAILTWEVNMFFTLKSSQVLFTGNLDELKGKRIGAVRNYSYGEHFDTHSPELNILRLETENGLLRNLLNRRCDIIIGNPIVLRTLAGQIPGGEDIVTTGPRVTNDPLYIGFSKAKGHELLARRFSDALKQFKAGADYRAILKKYNIH